MKLPIIKHVTQFIEQNDEDFIIETIETLESLTWVWHSREQDVTDYDACRI